MGCAAQSNFDPPMKSLVKPPRTFPRILTLRSEAVMLDADLAALYGVTTGNFNKAVARNLGRFPEDFAFVLTKEEFRSLMFQCGRSKGRGGRRKLPRGFTEHGAIMAAAILNSERAVAMSVYVVRAFVQMRRELLTNATLEARLQRIEKELLTHSTGLKELFRQIKPLLLPAPAPARRPIGFHVKEES
jgi:hypothetical protein